MGDSESREQRARYNMLKINMLKTTSTVFTTLTDITTYTCKIVEVRVDEDEVRRLDLTQISLGMR